MRRRLIPGALFALLLAVPLGLQAQDRIQLGIEYRPGVRPGIMVAAGAGLDSVRKIVERDLQFSDRFEIAYWPDSAPPLSGPLNPALYGEVLPITWAVELQPAEGGVEVVLHHLPSSEERLRAVRHLDPAGEGSQRLAIHRVSDEVVRLTTGGQGIASTSILFSLGDAIWSIDSDGANMRQMSRGTGIAMGAVWSPDGSSFAYTEIRDYAGPVILQTIGTGARRTIPTTTGAGYNMTPAFSPDGREMIFAKVSEAGTDLQKVDVARMCCSRPLTAGGRLAENLSPTYSPDGRRVAFVTTRPGRAQIYVMDADGASQGFLVPFDGNETGPSHSPEWSPNGSKIAFHRDIAGGRQILVYDFGTRRAEAVTSSGRNEDPSWAPDGRHLVFRSSRGGGQQLWVLDLESGNLRQLTNVNGNARLPAWSPSFAGTTP